MDPTTENTVEVQQYVSQLFPTLGSKNAGAAAAQYAGLGSNISQVISIMGEGELKLCFYVHVLSQRNFEAIFVCPTYYSQTAFGGKGYKVEIRHTLDLKTNGSDKLSSGLICHSSRHSWS